MVLGLNPTVENIDFTPHKLAYGTQWCRLTRDLDLHGVGSLTDRTVQMDSQFVIMSVPCTVLS